MGILGLNPMEKMGILWGIHGKPLNVCVDPMKSLGILMRILRGLYKGVYGDPMGSL